MRSLIFITALFAAVASGQTRFGATPFVAGGFGNAVFPGGTPANSPNVTRFTPNAVFPGGGGPRLVVPGRGPQRYTGSGGAAIPYAYPVPVYVGGGYDDSAAPPQAPAPPQQQPPNVTVVYPPAPAPVIVRQYGEQDMANPEPSAMDQPQQAQDETPTHYLIALKDHTVYSVVAYWVDGDTVHYFTPGNVHNQVSLALIDPTLTARLNKELGADVKLGEK